MNASTYLDAVSRGVSVLDRGGQSARAVTLGRSFATTVEELWDAITNGDRIPLWFMPVSGELELGGRYQLEGNAGGEITACEPPSRFAVTWEFAGETSWVEVRCMEEAESGARLELIHTMLHSPHWDEYGPGATGVGWEMGLLGLALHITQPDEPKPDEETFATSPGGKALLVGSATAWGEAAVAAGEDPASARTAARRTAAFYTGEPA